jgi:DNA-binding SARP family transcriptional activator
MPVQVSEPTSAPTHPCEDVSGQETLRCSLLGPLDVRRDGEPLELGPPKRRALLIRLLIEDGQPVSTDRLREALWKGRPPSGAVSSLHAHISRLRAVLEPEKRQRRVASVLVSGPLGYALNVPSGARDASRFDDAVQRARTLFTQGQLHQAQREVDGALHLWRGDALADVANYAFAAREINRLEEGRTSAEELRATLLLQLGDHEQAVAAAEALTVRAPLREAAWVLLMRALYLADRPAEALQRFETVRRILAEELGSDPGPALREAHLSVLRHDVAGLAPAPSQPKPVVLAPQPAAVPPLVGRADELAALGGLLDEAASSRTGWAVLSGESGIGKTRLAEDFAARAAARGFTVVWARCGHYLRNTGGSEEAEDRFSPIGQLLNALQPHAATDHGGVRMAGALADALAQQPTVCIIDDVHRADRELRELLRTYATVLRDLPLVVVCTARDTGDPALGELLAVLTRQGSALLLPLRPLSVSDVRKLLRDCAPPTAGPGESEVVRPDARELHRRGAGNPWVIAELLKLPARQQAGPHAVVPPTVARVLRAQLDGLDKPVLTMLETLAVAGEYLDSELLARLRTTSGQELLPLVEAAAGAGMLVWVESELPHGLGRYRIPELVHDVLLDGLTPLRRQALHAAVEEVLAAPDGHQPVCCGRHLAAAGPLMGPGWLLEAAFQGAEY